MVQAILFRSEVLVVRDVSTTAMTKSDRLSPHNVPSLDGNYKGKFGFDTFTHLRTVLNSPSWYEKLSLRPLHY